MRGTNGNQRLIRFNRFLVLRMWSCARITSRNVSNHYNTNACSESGIMKKSRRVQMGMGMEQNVKNNYGENGYGKEKEIIVVMVPLPAQGHLNQLFHLSCLISSYGIPVHYVGTATHNRQAKTRIHGWDAVTVSNLHFHDFPAPRSQILPHNPNGPSKFPSHILPVFNSTIELRQPIYEFLKELAATARKLVVIHDSLMPYTIQDATSIKNVESYCFQCCSAMTIYSFIWETAGKPDIPQAQIFQKGLPTPESCFPPEVTEFRRLQQESNIVNSGNIFNTCREIEGPYLDLLSEARLTGTDKGWALGPFNPVVIPADQGEKASDAGNRHKCLEWLDKQEPNSVIFVSFGTTTTFSDAEIKEMAAGLERSEQKFIWVLRDADRGDGLEWKTRRSHQLPEGYEERIEGRGIIIRDWAPQLETLAHPSTGGFMSHCGWNSTIESISMGVPIAAWPMHSDQPRNAILITEYLKIGVNVTEWSNQDELVTSETIEDVVRKLMDSNEGEEIRNRAAKLSDTIKKSVQEGGSTRSEMDSFIAHISAHS